MPGKFNPDDLKNPLYEHSQVLTIHELSAIYRNLAIQYECSHWWNFRTRFGLAIAGHTIHELITWLHQGKPSVRVKGETR